MNTFRLLRCSFLSILLLGSTVALAQEQFTYRVFIDTDNNSLTNNSNGCAYDIGSLASPKDIVGFEHYLELTMLAPGEIDQYGINGFMIPCDSGSWD